jgi:hypothetical protein
MAVIIRGSDYNEENRGDGFGSRRSYIGELIEHKKEINCWGS